MCCKLARISGTSLALQAANVGMWPWEDMVNQALVRNGLIQGSGAEGCRSAP